MIVVDASMLASALVDAGPVGKASAARLFGEQLTAPSLIDYEVLSTLRGLVLGRKLPSEDAERALRALPALPVERASCERLLPRIWELRANYSAYDASYVALAEKLNVPLVTGDAKLKRGSGARCVIELVG
ncbi:type II toxin-antitoxin system VapC family toxin [Streptomyces sp. HNM0575]|uniref:type II toxin-antitoxin system VapC family toxin n=1 Tax=Streptomyces sp. HNM0575 TaxID=2716338 RepID=UPI00145D5629|nr:type II toxin-antitoxin system VapC family toxin [Streptomyces sp. HNM0575]NLU75999.1 type II toxin-antitoxin system VapC family toxin [Streptomyces sp. HNM0575]